MKGFSYRDRDHSFGQTIQSLRTTIGLTQAGMAEYLHVSRKAVGEWEGGLTYPKAEHLKLFIALALEQKAFSAGREDEEIRALWQAARQKVLLDEVWLKMLLSRTKGSEEVTQLHEDTPGTSAGTLVATTSATRVDWLEAPSLSSFYGRDWELQLLSSWLLSDRCRIVTILGLGGIGKSSLAIHLMHLLSPHFSFVIWRSLRDAPSCLDLLDDLLLLLSPSSPRHPSLSFDTRLSLLLDALRSTRVLLVLDNLESLLDDRPPSGLFRPDFSLYSRFLLRLSQSDHQSCLLLTSREKPADLISLEGSQTPVRTLRLARLNSQACDLLFEELGLHGSPSERTRLCEAYAGNPLALKIVSQTILDLFDGSISSFLQQGQVVFGGVRHLLNEQYARLSPLQHTLLFWLAIARDPLSLRDLRSLLASPHSTADLLDAFESLRRRSLIEPAHLPASFTLQSVVLEYITARFIELAQREILEGSLHLLLEHALLLAHAPDYIRLTQQRLLLAPLLSHLRLLFSDPHDLDSRLLALLDHLRRQADYAQGYGPANLLALLYAHRGHLRSLDLSQLSLRSAFFQGVDMQDSSLFEATIKETLFSEAFDAINGIAISHDGKYWAAVSRRGEVRIWQENGQILHRVWQAHSERVWSLAFSPDGQTLVSGSWDSMVKLWNIASGTLIWAGRHTGNINGVTFAPDGEMVASGGANEVILWRARSGAQAQTLAHPHLVVAVAWSPQGDLLASGDVEGRLRLWRINATEQPLCLHTITGHTRLISGLAFSPDGNTLASASYDSSVKLWDAANGQLLETLTGHKQRVHRVAWSPDGRLLASGGYEKMIWLWDAEQKQYQGTLQGHTDSIIDLVFTSDSHSLLSSGDSTFRQWDVVNGRSIRVLQGNVEALFDVDWSPDSTQVVSGGSDKLVSICNIADGASTHVLRGHGGLVFGVGWSPDGTRLASSSWDATIRLWDPATSANLQVLRASEETTAFFCGIAWNPRGRWLAGTTYLNLLGVLVWDSTDGSLLWQSLGYPTPIRHVTWSPDGTKLAGCGDNGAIYLWDARDGTPLPQLAGHKGPIKNIDWSPDGAHLVTAAIDREGSELRVWDAYSGADIRTVTSHPGIINTVTWNSNGTQIISGGSDGMIRWWDAQSGESLQVRQGHRGTVQSLRRSPDGTKLASCGDDGAIVLWDLHRGTMLQTLRRDRPYERLNITGIKGLSQAQKETLRALGAIDTSNHNE